MTRASGRETWDRAKQAGFVIVSKDNDFHSVLMDTSRSHIDRLLDPGNDRVQLDTLVKAVHALGREFRLEQV